MRALSEIDAIELIVVDVYFSLKLSVIVLQDLAQMSFTFVRPDG